MESNVPRSKVKYGWAILGLALVSIVFGAVFALLAYVVHRDRVAMEELHAKWRMELVRDVKAGDSDPVVNVPGTLAMFADDPSCVANIQQITFATVEIAPEDAQHIARLQNLGSIGFYDTRGADHVLEHARELPIEGLFFEASYVSDDSLRHLADLPNLKRVQFEQVLTAQQIKILDQLPDHIAIVVTDGGHVTGVIERSNN